MLLHHHTDKLARVPLHCYKSCKATYTAFTTSNIFTLNTVGGFIAISCSPASLNQSDQNTRNTSIDAIRQEWQERSHSLQLGWLSELWLDRN